MVFATDEVSVDDGQPVELYRFRMRDTTTYWRYTSAAYDIDYDGNTYVATPGLSRSGVEETDDFLKTDLKLQMPSSHEFPTLFIYYIPDGTIDFTLFRGHGSSFIQYWDGVIKVVNPIEPDGYAGIICGPHTDSTQSPFLIRTYQRVCDVPLYSTPCGINKSSYAVSGLITAVSGLTVTSSVFGLKADDYFTGGYFDANGYKRKIKSHTGSVITLISQSPGIAVGNSGVAYPGCDHLRATCISKYNNILNYRGCDWIPDDEPFTQGPLDILPTQQYLV